MFIETIKITAGEVQNLPFHKKRMKETGEDLSFVAPPLPSLQALLPKQLSKEKLKCRILYDSEIKKIEFEIYRIRPINSLCIVEVDPSFHYSHKSTNRDAIDSLFEKRGACDDILIVKNGLVTDSSYCNLVFEKKNKLYTPKSFLLNGTKRQKLLSENRIIEREIKLEDIECYERVLLINAMIEIEDQLAIDIKNISKQTRR